MSADTNGLKPRNTAVALAATIALLPHMAGRLNCCVNTAAAPAAMAEKAPNRKKVVTTSVNKFKYFPPL